jgi:16S rRNA (guanine527-N7)-methyltransferase
VKHSRENNGAMTASMTAKEFARTTGTSAETVERIGRYVELLGKWQKKINLVGRETLQDVWRRHVLDSAQIASHISKLHGKIADMGSGAGFPGMVLAIVTNKHIHLIESDARKCAFLSEAARVTEAPVTIINGRVESVTEIKFDVVIARAVAPLNELIALARPILEPGGCCFFFKGQRVNDELTEALKHWKMFVARIASVTDPGAVILKLENIARNP